MQRVKKLIFYILLFVVSTVQAQTGKDQNPIWYTMMQDPKVNFYKAKQAHNDYWKAQKIQPIKELHDMEDAKYKHQFKNMTDAERKAYQHIILLNRAFENWVQTEQSWVQPDGRVLSQEEKTAILDKQRQELKEIEKKNGKN